MGRFRGLEAQGRAGGQPAIAVFGQVLANDQVQVQVLAQVQARAGLPALFAAALAVALGNQGQALGQVVLQPAAPGPAVALVAVVIGVGPAGIQVQAQAGNRACLLYTSDAADE